MLEMMIPAVDPGVMNVGDHELSSARASVVIDRLDRSNFSSGKSVSAMAVDLRTFEQEFSFNAQAINQITLKVGKGVEVRNKLTDEVENVDTLLSMQDEPAEVWIDEKEEGGTVYRELIDKYHQVASSEGDTTVVWVSYRDETVLNKGQNNRIYKAEKVGDLVRLTSYTVGGGEESMRRVLDNLSGAPVDRKATLLTTTLFFNDNELVSHERVFQVLDSSLTIVEKENGKRFLEKFRVEKEISDIQREIEGRQQEEMYKRLLTEQMENDGDLKTAFAMVAQAVTSLVNDSYEIADLQVLPKGNLDINQQTQLPHLHEDYVFGNNPVGRFGKDSVGMFDYDRFQDQVKFYQEENKEINSQSTPIEDLRLLSGEGKEDNIEFDFAGFTVISIINLLVNVSEASDIENFQSEETTIVIPTAEIIRRKGTNTFLTVSDQLEVSDKSFSYVELNDKIENTLSTLIGIWQSFIEITSLKAFDIERQTENFSARIGDLPEDEYFESDFFKKQDKKLFLATVGLLVGSDDGILQDLDQVQDNIGGLFQFAQDVLSILQNAEPLFTLKKESITEFQNNRERLAFFLSLLKSNELTVQQRLIISLFVFQELSELFENQNFEKHVMEKFKNKLELFHALKPFYERMSISKQNLILFLLKKKLGMDSYTKEEIEKIARILKYLKTILFTNKSLSGESKENRYINQFLYEYERGAFRRKNSGTNGLHKQACLFSYYVWLFEKYFSISCLYQLSIIA